MKTLLLTTAFFFSIIYAKAVPFSDTTNVSIQIGSAPKYSTIKVIDLITGGVISATVSNLSVQNNNSGIANVTPSANINGDMVMVKIEAIAPGSGTASVTCHVVYTDPGDGLQKSEDKTIVLSFTVLPAPPHGAKLSLVFN